MLEMIYQYGYLALYGMLALGIVGLPIPDETLMVFVGSLTSFGHMSFLVSILVGMMGSITGMLISYFVGKRIGRPAIDKYGKWFFMTPSRMRRAEAWFQKYGVWTVTFGYFIPGARHFTCYLSGISGISFWKYVVFAGSGATLWVLTFVSLGHFIGSNWKNIIIFVHQYVGVEIFAAIIAVLLIGYLALRIRHKKTA